MSANEISSLERALSLGQGKWIIDGHVPNQLNVTFLESLPRYYENNGYIAAPPGVSLAVWLGQARNNLARPVGDPDSFRFSPEERQLFGLLATEVGYSSGLQLRVSTSHTVGEIAVSKHFNVAGGATAWYPTTPTQIAGDIWIGKELAEQPYILFQTALHELAHALGIGHPHETSGPNPMLSSEDSLLYSVTSYSTSATYLKPATFMLYDVAVLHSYYGATRERTTPTEYKFDSSDVVPWLLPDTSISPRYSKTIVDGGGIDTIDATGAVTRDITLSILDPDSSVKSVP